MWYKPWVNAKEKKEKVDAAVNAHKESVSRLKKVVRQTKCDKGFVLGNLGTPFSSIPHEH